MYIMYIMYNIYICIYIHTHTHTHKHTHSLTHSLSLSLSHTHTHTYTHLLLIDGDLQVGPFQLCLSDAALEGHRRARATIAGALMQVPREMLRQLVGCGVGALAEGNGYEGGCHA